MPIKHQINCYRTRNGLRYENTSDICDATFTALHIQAANRVRDLRDQGHKAFAERQPDGFYRVFVAEKEKALD